MSDLAEQAQRWGIEPGYHDVFGTWHPASDETLRLLTDVLSRGRTEPAGYPPPPEQAPLRAWQGDGNRHWVLAVQLYGLRSEKNWGIGDFGDLKRLISIAARFGASGIGLNPLHALFPEAPERASPYAPNSRLFLNHLYIDVEAIPEFPGLAAARLKSKVAELRKTELVDYPAVGAAKMKGLRLAYEHFRKQATPERREKFDAYRQAMGDALLRFAAFEALREEHAPKPWTDWPEPWRSGEQSALREYQRTHLPNVEFYEFVQWVADEQLEACKAAAKASGMPVGLYIDLAVGIDPQGADAWSQQRTVLNAMSVGAPPDEFNTAGQDWGLAPFNPHNIGDNDFAPFRQLLAAAMRHAGAIRLDHVLGLKRVYMVPHGHQASAGVYVRFPFEQLLRVVAEESVKYRCSVIGEDLGTVPEGFRHTTGKWGLWSYRVMLFERQDDGRFKPPEWYPAEALATFNTHDLPSFAGWMQSHDLDVKHGLGIDPGETHESRQQAQSQLREALEDRSQGFASNDLAAVAKYLGATRCKLVAIALNDILGDPEQINIPGTIDEHPNWRRKAPVPLDALADNKEFKRVAEAFAQVGRRGGA
jgi:4-alpha-glucanotransferase